MGRRRRRVIRVFRRTLPKVYNCPRCGMVSVRVSIDDSGTAKVVCGTCNLTNHLPSQGKESIDIYNDFVDKFMAEQERV